MRERIARAMLLGAALGAAVPAGADDALRENREQLERLRTRIEAVQRALDQDRHREDEARQQLEATERRLVNLATDLRTLRRRLSEQAARREATRQERVAAAAALEQQRAVLARQVRTGYLIGQHGRAKLLLNLDGAAPLSRVVTYYDYLNRARVNRMRDIDQQIRALDALEQRLRDETRELEVTRARVQGTVTALEAVRAERGALVKALSARVAGGRNELKRLRAEERELQQLMEELQSAVSDVPADLGARPFARLRGKLPWPAEGKLLAQFGQPKAGGALKWNGLWIGGNEGDAVKAIATGRVVYVGWMHRYGLIAVLEHEGGYYSLYGHAQSVTVGVGDWVQAGDVIAAAGSTGGHTRPGLYFELRKGTDPINPRSWLGKKPG